MTTTTTKEGEKVAPPFISSGEISYLNALLTVMSTGVEDGDRTGTGTIGVPGLTITHNEDEGMIGIPPHLFTKSVHLKSILHELIWMISGSTNIEYLKDNNVTIWNEWADANGDLGPVYGKQWRNCDGIDQLQNAINLLRTDPSSRRIIVNSWNPRDLDAMALTPCHCMFQFISKPFSKHQKEAIREIADTDEKAEQILNKRVLNIVVTQRSADMFLGVPFNMMFYYTLMQLVAHITGHCAGRLTLNLGDAHIYLNHIDQVTRQLGRIEDIEMSDNNAQSTMINSKFDIPADCPAEEIDDFTYEMVSSFFGKYVHLGRIPAPISV